MSSKLEICSRKYCARKVRGKACLINTLEKTISSDFRNSRKRSMIQIDSIN